MFHLQKNPAFLQTAGLPEVRQAVEQAQQRLSDASRGLEFDPAAHRYSLHGRPMASVSSVVERFAPFDAAAKAEECSRNPRHEHYGKAPEEILAIWEQAGREAADAGTRVHAFAEACCLYLSGNEDQIEEQFRGRIQPEGLLAEDPKEEAAARWWADNDWQRYAVVAKETRVVNPALGYAGTFDLLLYDRYNAAYAVRDYKTNKDLFRWFGDYLLPPLNMIKSNDNGKYTVQQTMYSISLRRSGLQVISNELVWLREEGYQQVALPLGYDKVISYAISTINK